MNSTPTRRCGGFTLIELMVAVAIIALLVGLLIPGFSAVTTNAKNVTTTARIAVLDRGLASYRGEAALGGVYPPSHSDNPDNGAYLTIMDPYAPNGDKEIDAISGANLLAYAMVGADYQGTPGFRDFSNPPDNLWWDDLTSNFDGGGAYELSFPVRDPLKPRYPGSGGTYVDDGTRASIKTLKQLQLDQTLVPEPLTNNEQNAQDQPFFTDAWGRPILYYRANRAGRLMINIPGNDVAGIYDQRDNALLTGSAIALDIPGDLVGLDFGQGTFGEGNSPYRSQIFTSNGPQAAIVDLDNNGVNDIVESATFDFTFERLIVDTSVKSRNTPVHPKTYLLISAGADATYGTLDDVVNWTRE